MKYSPPVFTMKFHPDLLVWESRRADAFEERIGEEFEEGRSKKQPQDQEGLGAHVKTNISNFSWNLVAHVAKCMQGSIKWKPWDKECDHENGNEASVGGDYWSKWWPDTIRVSPRHWSIRLGSFCFTRICFEKSYTRFSLDWSVCCHFLDDDMMTSILNDLVEIVTLYWLSEIYKHLVDIATIRKGDHDQANSH